MPPAMKGGAKMGLLDLIVDELNEHLTDEQKENGEKWQRLHSEQYQIVQTENGIFRNPIKEKK